MPRLNSDALAWIGHDPAKRALFVRLANGDLWSFDAVPVRVYRAFLSAEDPSEFFEQHVVKVFGGHRLHEPPEGLGGGLHDLA